MIRIGIVGCGRILNAHLQGYKALREHGIDNFRITALCARRREDAHMFVRRGEGPPPRPPVLDPASGDPLAAPQTYLSDFQDDVEPLIYTDYHELIACEGVDAVNDLTTLALHHEVGLLALGAGKHLLTQKPLAISVRAAERLVRLAADRGMTLGVFENVRQSPAVRAAAWATRTGLIGQVQAAVIGSLGGPWSPDRVVADTPWRHQKLLAGGGSSIDIGVHQMHWLRYVVGEIAAVGATARTFEPLRYRRDSHGRVVEEVRVDVDDTYLATASFERGAIGQLLWSWGIHGEALDIPGTPALFGSNGSIRDGEVVLDGGRRLPLQQQFEQSLTAREREQYFPLGLRDPYAIQQLDWLRAIEHGTDPETSGQEGLRDLACAFAILESSMLGRQVTVHEVLDHSVDIYQHEIDEHYGLL
ncbi:MAG TPA: Gfo/Idh/MocA family oxidoreductase [Chloroflexota bacterium]|nr:Gfo/Idh/MocA family oxidoreductase [Chloroflexota bacterium]